MSMKSLHTSIMPASFVGTVDTPMDEEEIPTTVGFIDMKGDLNPGLPALPKKDLWIAFRLDYSVCFLAIGDSIVSRKS